VSVAHGWWHGAYCSLKALGSCIPAHSAFSAPAARVRRRAAIVPPAGPGAGYYWDPLLPSSIAANAAGAPVMCPAGSWCSGYSRDALPVACGAHLMSLDASSGFGDCCECSIFRVSASWPLWLSARQDATLSQNVRRKLTPDPCLLCTLQSLWLATGGMPPSAPPSSVPWPPTAWVAAGLLLPWRVVAT